MNKFTTLLTASALTVVAAQANSATWTVVGGGNADMGVAVGQVTGTYDDVTGAFDFDIGDYSTAVSGGPTINAVIEITDLNHAGDSDDIGLAFDATGSFACSGDTLGEQYICDGFPTGPIPGDNILTAFAFDLETGVGSYTFDVLSQGVSSTIGFDAVADVPLPAAAWLFGSALLGLAGIGRRRKHA